MTDTPQMPEAKGQVSDAVKGNWVDTWAPKATRPFLRLSRADRPIGTWLLFIPCVWGVLLAALSDGGFRLWDIWIILGCGIGAFLMRGAGCTWNDIADREFDAQVERTKSRPLPSGQVSVKSAVVWMILQTAIAGIILFSYSWPTIICGLASLGLVLVYPFAKRFTWWPQAFLGLAINWGALLGWVAHTGRLEWPAIGLYISGIFWTLFYDTIYAHQDREDDALIGVKSTARLFEKNSNRWLRGFLAASITIMGIAVIGAAINASVLSLVLALGGVWAMGWHLAWQLRNFDVENSESFRTLFLSNRNAGLIPVLFFAVALIV